MRINVSTRGTTLRTNSGANRLSVNNNNVTLNTGGGGIVYITGDMRYVDNVTDLANLTNIVNKEVVYVKDKYRGGHFWYDNTDTTTSDDGGTVFVYGTKRWKRIINNNTFNVSWWAGQPYVSGAYPDNTTHIQNCVYAAMRYNVATGQRTKILFHSGYYFITDTIDFTTNPDSPATVVSGWTIEGVQTGSLVCVKPGTTIAGPMFNFNKNSSGISRHNIVKNIYFFSDASLGKCQYVIDFSYNNRFGMYNCRTSRISNEADVVINFCYEGLIQQCNFSGGEDLSPPLASDGLQMNNEANAILIQQCSIDNYIGNGSTISGSGIYFGQSKGLTVDTCTIQQCNYGITLATGSREASIVGGGYFEGNEYADIRIGVNGGTVYNTYICGGSIKSAGTATYPDTNGILIDGANIVGCTVEAVGFDNADPIMLVPKGNQSIQDLLFINCRTGDTIYSYRNLIKTSQQMYMDNIKVINPGTSLNGQETPSFTPIIQDQFTNHITDFNTWLDAGGGPTTDFLTQDGTWIGSPVWKKNTADAETMIFTLSDVTGFTNQVITFSFWCKFNGTINANDLVLITDQSDNAIGASRPLRPGTLSTTNFVKMHVYALVDSADTAVKIKILTRDNNIYFAKPELKLGFV